MQTIFKSIFLAFSFLLLSCNSTVQHQDDYSKKIDSLISLKNPRPFNGTILITQNGKVKYQKTQGFQNVNTQKPLQQNDQFEIMSNSKLFTAVLLLKEVEKGHVNLQDPIKKYLPNLTQKWADSVTVHQLLNHTHGIAAIDKPLLFKSGFDFKYGDLSNALLGKIIENTSHKTYRTLAEELFKSLDMNNTFCYLKDQKRNLVSGHRNKDNNFTVVENSMIVEENIPAHGIVSTAEDLSKWNNALHHGKILSPKSYQLMTTASAKSQHDVFGKDKMGYGYNIRIAQQNSIQYLGHTGLGDGFASMNLFVPKSNLSIIVLENQMAAKPELYYYFETLIKNIVLNSKSLNP